VGNSVPYFRGGRTKSRLRNVLAPTWQAPNSTGSYALRGTDYASLNFVRPDGTLNVNTDLPVPQEGVRTEVSLLLRRTVPSSDKPGVIVRDTTTVTQAVLGQAFPPSHERLTFVIRPSVGHVPGDSVVRFEAPGTSTWPVEDLTFRATEDDASMVCRVPAGAGRRDRGKTTEFEVNIAPGKEGLYQLPVFVLPSNVVTVNGDAAATTPSDNRAMVIVPLKSGANLVKIRTRPDPVAWAVSAGAIVAMVAGASWAVSKRPRAGRNDGSHGP